MSEWNENRLDEELETLMNEMPEQDDLEKKIIQNINRRIRKTVFRTLSGIVFVLLVAFLVVNPLMNAMFFNPYELNKEPEQKMFAVLRDYFDTTCPYREILSLDVERKGFARYGLEMQVADLTEPLVISGPNVWCDMNYGNYENIIDSDLTMSHLMGRFSWDYESQEEMIEKISELPKSAMIYLSVSDTSPKSIEELRNTVVELEWFQVYQPNVEFQGGLSASPRALYAEDDERDEMTEQELLKVYLSNLENLLAHQEVWSQLGLDDGRMNYFDTERTLTETYEDAKLLTTLTSENYCVSGKRDEVLQFLQENTTDSIFVENVRLW